MATHNKNESHETPPAAAPKASLMDTLRAWMPRALMLGVIWGIAIFLWGTFGNWTRDQYIASEREIAAREAQGISDWLEAAVAPLDRLAQDSRLAAGLDLPAGVESLPVQRVLYEYAYLNNQSEVYMVDLLRGRVGSTAGSSPLPEGAVERLAEMSGGGQMIFGIGQRGGQMLLARRVSAPLPNNAFVIVPMSLATLATTQPTYRLPKERELNVIVPHATGWAEWRDGEAGFNVDDETKAAMDAGEQVYAQGGGMVVAIPLEGWPEVKMAIHSPGAVGGAKILPQLLVALWAVAMTILVLWREGGALKRKVMAVAGPVLAPLGKVAGPVKGVLAKLGDALSVSWRHANTADIPLVDGPGAFGIDDFLSSDEAAKRLGTKRKGGPRLPLKLNQEAPENLKRGAGLHLPEDKQQPPHKMNWPTDKGPEKAAEFVPPVDVEDIEAVVVEALKKRRVRLLYQPIYRAGDNMPVMHEVYARLFRGDGKIITPDIFMPIAAKNKLTLDLDLMVLRKVVNEHFTSNSVPATPLALNISSTSLDGIAYLQEMAAQGPRVLQKISFEVSSQEMIRDPKALRLLKELQKHGGNLSVDYFGGGTAMLEASKAMGFNHVKMNCMRLIGTDAGKKEIISMCRHALGIGLPIILEMVGDDEGLKFARRAGAEFLQGYALARPRETLSLDPLDMPVDAIAGLAPTS